MKLNNETKIGLMVIIVIVILFALWIKTGKFNLSEGGYTLKVIFDDINGVNLNSPVMFNGYEMGVVKDIIVKDYKDKTRMELTIWIDSRAKLREGAKAYIKNLGFMGEKYVGLTSGDRSGAYLPAGSVLQGIEPPDFDKLLGEGQEIAIQVSAPRSSLSRWMALPMRTMSRRSSTKRVLRFAPVITAPGR